MSDVYHEIKIANTTTHCTGPPRDSNPLLMRQRRNGYSLSQVNYICKCFDISSHFVLSTGTCILRPIVVIYNMGVTV